MSIIGAIASGIAGKRNRRAEERWARAQWKREVKLANQHRLEDLHNQRQAMFEQREWALMDRAHQEAQQATQFSRLRLAAEEAGFNPLTALGAGGGAGAAFVSTPPMASAVVPSGGAVVPAAASVSSPLLSQDAIYSGFQEVGSILSGQAALDQQEQRARIDLMRIEAARQGAELAQARQGPILRTPAAVRTVANNPALASSPPMTAGPKQPLFRTVTGLDGEEIIQPDMDVAADFETSAMSAAADHRLGDWIGDLTAGNAPGVFRAFARGTSYPARAALEAVRSGFDAVGGQVNTKPPVITARRKEREGRMAFPSLGF